MTSQKFLGLLLGFLALVFTGVAGSATFPAKPEVDNLFSQYGDSTPGCSLAVGRAGVIVYSRGYGMADLDHGIPNTPSTVFHAGSVAKQFTAMALLLLAQQTPAPLTLDDEVLTHMPELPKVAEKVTIRQLLQHTSGLRDQWTLATMAGWRLSDDVVTLDDVLGFVARMKTPNFVAGLNWSYSNTNYTLAGLIVKRKNAAGQTLAQFASDNMFTPLSMTSTRFVERHGEIVANRAYGYRGRDVSDQPPFEMRMPNYDLAGPTNLVTTVEDLIRWEANFSSKVVGNDAIFKQMHEPRRINDENAYGLGLFIREDKVGGRIIEHDGRDAGYRSHLFRYPDKQLAVALLCNVWMPDNTTTGLVRKIAAAFLNTQPTASSPPQPLVLPKEKPASRSLAEYVGRYRNEELGADYDISLADGKLWIARPRYAPASLVSLGQDTFMVTDFSAVLPRPLLSFQTDSAGKIHRLVMDDRKWGGMGRLWDFTFTRSP